MLIEKSRARIMIKAPAFSILLMYLRFVAVPGMDRISTNGNCIFFEPSYFRKLKNEEMDFILCHQIMHILREDIWRSDIHAFLNYHYACDLKINSMLLEDAMFDCSHSLSERIKHKLPGTNVSVKEMSVEQILSNLPFDLECFDNRLKRKYIIDSDVYWGKTPTVFGSTLILDRDESEYLDIFSEDLIAVDSREKDLWQERAAMAFNAISWKKSGDNSKKNAVDNIFGLLERIVEKLRKPTIDWKKILNDFLQEQICDYSFSPPDRRFEETGFFLPDFNEKNFMSKEILFMVDTSGSVDDKALASVYSEIKGALEQYDGKLIGFLGFFDIKSTTPVPMNSVDDLLSIVPVGGGGTNFFSIFDDFRNNLPACIIVFTDGKGKFPPEEIAQGVPVLWIIDNVDITPPWGKTIRLPKIKRRS